MAMQVNHKRDEARRRWKEYKDHKYKTNASNATHVVTMYLEEILVLPTFLMTS